MNHYKITIEHLNYYCVITKFYLLQHSISYFGEKKHKKNPALSWIFKNFISVFEDL